MDNKQESKSSPPSWWVTAPGILTAIAGLITATGGFLIVMNQIGCFDKTVHKENPVVQTPTESKETKQKINESKKDSADQTAKDYSFTTTTNSPVKLSLPGDMNFENVKIKFLELTRDKYSTDNSSLKIKFRLFNGGTGYATFDYYLFRLLFDGQILSPEKAAQGYVDPKSSEDNDVLFVFPNSTKEAELQISYFYDEKMTTKIPINLNP